MKAIVPRTIYLWVWLVLLVLLGATVGLSRLDLKSFNVIAALLIAIAKTLLILLFFMHVRYSPRLIWVLAGAGFFWLAIFIDLTLGDYLTRTFSWTH